jgi:hypothetical protein
MFGVRTDRFDDEVEFVAATDVARYTLGQSRPDELRLGEVMEPANALRFEVPHQEHCAFRVFRLREREHLALP